MVIGDVEEGDNRNLVEASKPIDISKVMPDGLPPQTTEQSKPSTFEEKKAIESGQEQFTNKKPGPPMMKVFIDKEGYITFPDGSRYKGGL